VSFADFAQGAGVAGGRGGCRRTSRKGGRSGVALLLVLIVISVGVVLSMRFLQVAGMRWTMSQTLVNSKKAEHLAESGVAEATYWFRHPELTGGVLWAGVANRQPYGGGDYYNVTVTQEVDPRKVTVRTDGHVVENGQEVMVRRAKAEFLRCYGFPDAVTTPQDLVLPQSVTVVGNVYAGANLDNRGYLDGSVWVGVAAVNTGTIVGQTYVNAPVRALGTYSVSWPVTYMHGGLPYSAEPILLDTLVNQTLGSSAPNPMGVWSRSGDLSLSGLTQVGGTLVVSGDLHVLANSTTTITAKTGFPALEVEGNLIVDGDGSNTTINGVVIVHGKIQSSGGMPNTRLKVKGGVLFPNAGGGFDAGFSTEPRVTIEHDATRTDVSGFHSSQPQMVAGVLQTSYREEGV